MKLVKYTSTIDMHAHLKITDNALNNNPGVPPYKLLTTPFLLLTAFTFLDRFK